MKKALFWLLFLGLLAGCVASGWMTVMAAQYLEWGRVLFYGVIALLCGEGIALVLMNWTRF